MDSSLGPVGAAAQARERQGLAAMVAGGALLGTLGVCLLEAGQPAATAVWFRCAFGALSLALYAALAGRLGELRPTRAALPALLGSSGLMLANWWLFFEALARLPLAVATVVFHVQPFWVLGLGAWWLGERVSRAQWAWAGAAFAGLALASGELGGAPPGAGLSGRGLALCLAGSLAYAGVTLIARAARASSALALAWWQCALGTLLLLAWPLREGWPAWGPAWAWLAALGVVHTGLAYALLYAGIARLPAGRIAPLQFVYPLVAIAVDRVVYGRMLEMLQWAGVLLMAAALLGVQRGARPPARH